MKLTDDEIIAVRKATRVSNFDTPWSDVIGFGRALEEAIAEKDRLAETHALRVDINQISRRSGFRS